MTRIAPLALILAALAVPALAQEEADPEIDIDGDGLYSLDELVAVFPELTAETVTMADADGDGLLSPAETAAAQEAGLMPERQE